MVELESMLSFTQAELRSLPPPPSNDPVLEVNQLVSEFIDELFRHAEGSPNALSTPGRHGTIGKRNHFEDIRKVHEDFARKIRRTAPNFQPLGRNDSPALPIPTEEYYIYERISHDLTASPEPQTRCRLCLPAYL